MENIYKPSEFFCTDLLDVEKQFNEFSDIVRETNLGSNNLKSNLAHLLSDIKQNQLNALQKSCSINKLTCPKEMNLIELPDTILSQHKLHITPYPVTAESVNNLRTIAVREEFKEQPENYAKYRHQMRQEFETNIMKREQSSRPHSLKPNKDILYTLRIYQPFYYKFAKKNYYKHCRYSHEIVALGSNLLSDIRDKILCKSDIGICRETDFPVTNLEALANMTASDVYPSNFIFIENVFYNDLRHRESIDYSSVILEWAKKWKVGNFKTARMEKVTLSQINIRLGYPYLYQHQAECEHLLVFSEVRLLKNADFLNKKDYPFYKSIARYSSQLCMMCGLTTAHWICIGSPRLPADNTFLCQECCSSYNYIDGKKIDDVRIFPYYDRSTVL